MREAAGPDSALPPVGRDRPADGALRLPWLCPSAESLAALAQPASSDSWLVVRDDPAAVLLLLRTAPSASPRSFLPLLDSAVPLEEAARHLGGTAVGVLDWRTPAARQVHASALAIARRAEELARSSEDGEPDAAWSAGLLAPLGWLAVCAVDPSATVRCWSDPHSARDPTASQRHHWGLDQDAIARRLVRDWRLPNWLAGIVGNLALPEETAHALGAPPGLLRVVRQAVIDVSRDPGSDLGLVAPVPSRSVGRPPRSHKAPPEPPPVPSIRWSSPYGQPVLPDLLRAAAENRHRKDASFRERLEAENDLLRHALERRVRAEEERVRARHLEALAEFAAGAGHEINNPLAVILGQAQYLQAHSPEWFTPGGEGHVTGALQAIVAQTRRVHALLRGLMQFARPAPPDPVWFDLPTLLGEVISGVDELARERGVRLEVGVKPDRLAVFADREQVRTAVTCLARNAVEAAPPDGWARLLVREPAAGDGIEIAVEDSGPGPGAECHERLFDPFFSGRNAGRGRGLGLPTAWRLARLNGGDVRLETPSPGQPTRFVIALPRKVPPVPEGPALPPGEPPPTGAPLPALPAVPVSCNGHHD